MDINKILTDAIAEIETAISIEDLLQKKANFLGKKSPLNAILKSLSTLSKEEKTQIGSRINKIKVELEELVTSKIKYFEEKKIEDQINSQKIDIHFDPDNFTLSNLHPLQIVQNELEDIFIKMGFKVKTSPELELDLYNFERANIPFDHPARDMQDTFYIDDQRLLRTHTTAVQMHYLEENSDNLPIMVVCPGKVYRRDDDDATHSHQFMQIEGIVVAENIRMSDLKGCLESLVQAMFDEKVQIRFRPSYFQFTEPSVEVDVSCHICNGDGCSLCKYSGWIEILGSGMIHPKVLEMAGIDSQKYSGFAFGAGIERIAMIKYGIDDIRLFYQNDLRFLKQFPRFK